MAQTATTALEAGGSGEEMQQEELFHVQEELSFRAQDCSWWGAAQREHQAAREGVALFDLSSFGEQPHGRRPAQLTPQSLSLN